MSRHTIENTALMPGVRFVYGTNRLPFSAYFFQAWRPFTEKDAAEGSPYCERDAEIGKPFCEIDVSTDPMRTMHPPLEKDIEGFERDKYGKVIHVYGNDFIINCILMATNSCMLPKDEVDIHLERIACILTHADM